MASLLLLTPAAIAMQVALTHAAAESRLNAWSEVLRAFKKMFPRFVAIFLIVESCLLLLLVGFLLALQWFGDWALFATVACALIGNALTCASLACMVAKNLGPLDAIWEAAVFAVRHPKAVLKAVVPQLLLLGVFVSYSVRNHQPVALTPPPPPSASRLWFFRSTDRSGNFVDLFWVLGMNDSSTWFTKISTEAGQEPWPLTTYLMQTLTIILSAMFITQYSLIYLYAPVAPDKRAGFDVVLATPPNQGS